MRAREAVHFSRPPPQVSFKSKIVAEIVENRDGLMSKILKDRFEMHHGGAIDWPRFF